MTCAAFGAVDITPPPGVPMGGNVRADRAARGIHQPLLATVMVLEAGATVVLVGCDLLAVSTELSAPVKQHIAAALGIPPDHIVVFATHTHSGPQIARETPTAIEPGPVWERWLRDAVDRITECAGKTAAELRPATVEWGTARVRGLSFNRRLRLHSGGTRMNFEPGDPGDVAGPWGPVDEELTAIRVLGADGAPIGALVHFTLHPAILVSEQWLFARDFVGPLVRTVQESIGAVPVLFANGAEGNVNHLDHRLGRQGDPFGEIERIGVRLGAAAIQALAHARPIRDPHVTVNAVPMRLRQRPITNEMLQDAQNVLDRAGGVIPSWTDGVPPEAYADWLLRRAPHYPSTVEVRPIVVSIGPLCFAFVPGEPFVEFGHELRERHPGRHARVVALADASIGYVPTVSAFDQGGYETTFGTSTIAPGEGERLFSSIDATVSGAGNEERR